MPRTGTTLCHPKNWPCRSERNPALDTLALNSPLVHLNGDNAYSPQIPDTKLHGDIQSSIPTSATMSFVKMQKTQSLTRPTTHAAISTSHNSILP